RQTVVLKSTNTDDKIYYTTDGSIPTTASTLYTAPIIVSTTTTIKALGVNRNNQAGNVSSFTYTINPDLDTEKPSITASMPVGHSESSVNVYFTIKDNKSKSTTAYYTVDGTPATTSSPVYVSGDALAGLPGPEINISRTTTFNFLVVDGAGNKTTESFFYNIGPISANGDFREESIYFLLTARFYDGDSSNNRYCRSDDTSGNKANNDPPWRGDFKGLVEKLDYIKALGFSAIWISAPVLNRSDYDYHGYHAWDMEKIDGRLTSPGYDYQRLINECHARKIKLIQDIVLNHSGRYGINDKAEVKYWGDLNDPQWGNGTAIDYYDEYNPNFEYDGVSIEPKSGKSYYNGDLWQKEKPDLPWEGVEEKQWWPGGYGGTIPHAGELDRLWGVKSPYSSPEGYKIWHFQWPGMYESQFSLLNPEWYHCYWLKNWEDYTCQYGTIHEDCLDLNTESPVVQKYLTDAYSRYIQMGVDAFRVDTAKHISRNTFNRRFTPAFHKAAAAAGNPNFFMFAEVCVRDHGVWNKGNAALSVPFYTWKERTTYSADDKTAAWESYNYETSIMGADKQPVSNNHLLVGNEYHKPDYSQYSGMSVIDFRMHWNFRDASSAFSIRDGDKYTNDATWSVTYVDSHDYSPIEGGSNTYLRYNAGASAFAENWDLMFTWRGIPCIFYGNEILFKEGKVIDMGPNMPLEDTGRAYFGKHLEGTVETTDFGIWKNASGEISTTLTHPLAKHVTRLNRIRRAIPALQKGQYSTENVSGAIAFKKRFTDTDKKVDSFALVTISGDSTFSSIPNGTYVDSVTGDKKVVTNNTLTASCAGKGNMRIYVLNTANTPAPGKIGEDTQWLK
ncbi:MAG: alpha-amylase family glycosyl hydrolase, partial [Clostridia bacterium]|nr:alpha-amylase family glycosyl hydrolase [Clostridia bacterium]